MTHSRIKHTHTHKLPLVDGAHRNGVLCDYIYIYKSAARAGPMVRAPYLASRAIRVQRDTTIYLTRTRDTNKFTKTLGVEAG